MQMLRIADILPELVEEIRQFLEAEGRPEIATQFADLMLKSWTYEADEDSGYIYLAGQRPLNFVEQKVIGTHHGECIEIEKCDGLVVLDTDNFNRVTGIEILNRKDIKQRLERSPTTPPTIQ
jgi:hypothetical protein